MFHIEDKMLLLIDMVSKSSPHHGWYKMKICIKLTSTYQIYSPSNLSLGILRLCLLWNALYNNSKIKFVRRLFDVFNYIYLKPPHVDNFLFYKKHQCYWELAQMRTKKSQSWHHLKQPIHANRKIQQHAKYKWREFAPCLIFQRVGGRFWLRSEPYLPKPKY